MPWEDLDEELAETFAELGGRDRLQDALEKQRAFIQNYARTWKRENWPRIRLAILSDPVRLARIRAYARTFAKLPAQLARRREWKRKNAKPYQQWDQKSRDKHAARNRKYRATSPKHRARETARLAKRWAAIKADPALHAAHLKRLAARRAARLRDPSVRQAQREAARRYHHARTMRDPEWVKRQRARTRAYMRKVRLTRKT